MENPTDSICDTDYKSLVNQCLEICSALKDKGCKFSLSLRLGSSFNFSLSSEGCSPEATKKTRRSPSYLRRQTRRRAAFLERKKKLPLADVVTPTTHNNQGCTQGGATLLDKKTASPWQTAASEDETVVDKDCSLDLNPNPTYPRGSAESMETDGSDENVFDSKSNQVNEHGETMITLPCDECQDEVTRWWKPPLIWPQDFYDIYFEMFLCNSCLSSMMKQVVETSGFKQPTL